MNCEQNTEVLRESAEAAFDNDCESCAGRASAVSCYSTAAARRNCTEFDLRDFRDQPTAWYPCSPNTFAAELRIRQQNSCCCRCGCCPCCCSCRCGCC